MRALPRRDDDRYVPMTERDLDEVVAAEKEVYPFPWTRGNFLDALQAGYSAWVLRNPAGQVAAYSVMMMALDEAHLLNLSVARDAQRTGLGWRTLGWMADVARGYGGRWFKYVKRFNGVTREVNRWHLRPDGTKNEDHFWSHEAVRYDSDFKVASFEVGLRFAFEVVPRTCFAMHQQRLPFGCHAWPRYDRSFWESYLLKS